MKLLLSYAFIAFCTFLSESECDKLHQGTFKLTDVDGSENIVTRNDSIQTEKVMKTGSITEFNIKWTSDCTYLLYNRRVIFGEDIIPLGFKIDTLYNEIIEVKEMKHTVRSKMRGYDFIIDAELTLIK